MQGGRLERTLEMTILIRAINQTTGAFSGVRLAATAAIMAIGAGLAYSAKQAADFQQGLTTLATGAGEAVDKLQMVGDGIKQVSIETGTTTDDLIKSMFLIESASFRGASGLQVLLTAAEGAKTGNTDLVKTTQVLLTMLHDYHQPASQAVADTNSIIATVKNGTMTMDDLNGAMVNVLSIASAFHIKLADVEGALATMSVAGDKGSAAGTHLAMMLRMLSNPATAAANEMKAMGINSINLANEMRISLPLALQEIGTAVRQHFTPGSVEFNRAVTTILGGTRSGVAGLELMNANLPIFRTNAENAANAASLAGNNVNGWALVQQNFTTQLAQTQAALNVAAIDIGTMLIPVLERALAAVTPLIGQFTHWVETSPDFQNAVNNVATAIGNAAQTTGNFVQGVGNLYQAFQQGQPYAVALGTALVSIGVAIGILKTLEFEATIAGWLMRFSSLTDMVAQFAYTYLPKLTTAIELMSLQTGISMTALGVGFATATAGVSLLIGALVVAAIKGNDFSTTLQQSMDQLGNSAQDTAMKQKAAAGDAIIAAQQQQQASNDAAAKQKANAVQVQGAWDAASSNSSRDWNNSTATTIRASANMTAQMIIDQQKIADAAARDAANAASSWSNFISQMHAQGIDPINGGPWSPTSGTQRGGPHRPGGPPGGLLQSPGVGGPRPTGHASGIMNSPYGHWATVGERGPELMYVPRGSNIYPNGTGPGGHTFVINVSTMAGSRAEINRMVDLLEEEIGRRFRSQTSSFSYGGLQ